MQLMIKILKFKLTWWWTSDKSKLDKEKKWWVILTEHEGLKIKRFRFCRVVTSHWKHHNPCCQRNKWGCKTILKEKCWKS